MFTIATWGIDSAQFLTAYASICVAAAGAVWWQRRHAIGPRERGCDPLPELGPYELALLAGGPQLAITSTLARLHHDKLLRIQQKSGAMKVAGELELAADPLEQAAFEAVRRAPGIRIEALRRAVEESEALTAVSARLAEAGLLLDEEQAARVRALWIVGALLTLLGIGGIAAGPGGDTATVCTAAIVLVVATATLWLFRQRPLATERGRDVLDRHRTQSEELHRHPVAARGAMAVALFGGSALWNVDPATASALEVPLEGSSGSREWFSAGVVTGTCAASSACDGGGCGGCG